MASTISGGTTSNIYKGRAKVSGETFFLFFFSAELFLADPSIFAVFPNEINVLNRTTIARKKKRVVHYIFTIDKLSIDVYSRIGQRVSVILF